MMNLQNIQEEIAKLEDFINEKKQGDKDDIFVLITHLLSECGELADEIKGLEGKRAESPENYSKGAIAEELVDIIICVLRIARSYDIHLDDYFLERIDEIKKKFEH